MAQNIIDIDRLKDLNARRGYHWFEPSTMRFFNSRVARYGYLSADRSTAYFTSSEKGPDGIRAWSIRSANLNTGQVDTVGKFQAYSSRKAADREAQRIAHN